MSAAYQYCNVSSITECWASEAFADLLEHPEAPLLSLRLAASRSVWTPPATRQAGAVGGVHLSLWADEWAHAFAALIGFEADGRRFAHTGDQYFFLDAQGNFNRRSVYLVDKRISQNHVYRNGALLDGYALSAAWMREWRPEIVLTGISRRCIPTKRFWH